MKYEERQCDTGIYLYFPNKEFSRSKREFFKCATGIYILSIKSL